MKKGKVKKIITFIAVGLLAITVIAAVLFTLFGDKLIRTAIVTGGNKALQVDVRLEDISLSVLRGKVELNNLEIDNPEGYQHESLMKIGHVFMDLNMTTLLSDTIEMDMIQLENIKLVIEQRGTTNNLKEILGNLPKSESTEPEPEAKPKEEGAGKNFRIKVLEINNIEVEVKLLPISGRADTVTLKMKPIRMENLGTDQKIDAAGVTAEILKAIAKGVAGESALPSDITDSVSGLFKGGRDATKGAADALEGLGDLFKKKEKEE